MTSFTNSAVMFAAVMFVLFVMFVTDTFRHTVNIGCVDLYL